MKVSSRLNYAQAKFDQFRPQKVSQRIFTEGNRSVLSKDFIPAALRLWLP